MPVKFQEQISSGWSFLKRFERCQTNEYSMVISVARNETLVDIIIMFNENLYFNLVSFCNDDINSYKLILALTS